MIPFKSEPYKRMDAPTGALYHFPFDEPITSPFQFVDNDGSASATELLVGAENCDHPCFGSPRTGVEPANTPSTLTIGSTLPAWFGAADVTIYGWMQVGDASAFEVIWDVYNTALGETYLQFSQVGGELRYTYTGSAGATQTVTTTNLNLVDGERIFWSVTRSSVRLTPNIPNNVNVQFNVYRESDGSFYQESFGLQIGRTTIAGVDVRIFNNRNGDFHSTACHADFGLSTEALSDIWHRGAVADAKCTFDQKKLMNVVDIGQSTEGLCWRWPKLCARVSYREDCVSPWTPLVTPEGLTCADLLKSVSVTCVEGSSVGQAQVKLVRELWGNNIFDLENPSGRDVLDCKIAMRIETCIAPPHLFAPGEEPEYIWQPMFEGLIEGVQFDVDCITVDLADNCAVLRDTWLFNRVDFGEVGATWFTSTSGPLEEEDIVHGLGAAVLGSGTFPLEQVINTLITVGYRQAEAFGGEPPGWCSNRGIWDPEGLITGAITNTFVTEKCVSLLSELNRILGPAGLSIGCGYDPDTGSFRPRVFRKKGLPAFTFDAATIAPNMTTGVGTMRLNCADIRNKACVYYGPVDPAGPNAAGDDYRLNRERCADDATSLQRYGLLPVKINEDSQASPIKTFAQAQLLADLVVDELSVPLYTYDFETMLRPDIGVGDIILVETDDKLPYGGLARVASCRHNIDQNGGRSSFTVFGRTS